MDLSYIATFLERYLSNTNWASANLITASNQDSMVSATLSLQSPSSNVRVQSSETTFWSITYHSTTSHLVPQRTWTPAMAMIVQFEKCRHSQLVQKRKAVTSTRNSCLSLP